MKPKISIIIPTYNTENFLSDCLNSCVNQKSANYEIIIVDNNSTDHTLKVTEKFTQKYPFINIIKHKKNLGLVQSRITGAKAAVGEYLMYIDSDDYLISDYALNKLSHIINKTKADIIQFGIEHEWQEWFTPLSLSLISKLELQSLYFHNEIGCSTLWSRLIKRDLYLKSISQIPENINISQSEDILQMPIIMENAASYIGIKNKLYCFRTRQYSTQQGHYSFSRLIKTLKNDKIILDILKNELISEHYHSVVHALCHHNLDNLISALDTDPHNSNSLVLELFQETFTIEIILEQLYKYSLYQNIPLMAYLWKNSVFPDAIATSQKKLGLITDNLYLGGAERVYSILIKEMVDRKWEIAVFTKTGIHHRDFPIPHNIQRTTVGTNIKQWIEFIKNSTIGVFLVHDEDDPISINYLLIFCLKMFGKKVIVFNHCDHFHFTKVSCLHAQALINTIRTAMFAKLDTICMLLPYNIEYFNLLGFSNVFLINNPLTFDLENVTPSLCEEPYIIWCGRFVHEKRILEFLQVIPQALFSLPENTKIIILGDGPLKEEVDHFISANNLEDHVILPEFVDPESYYQKASLHVMTSVSESFSMVLTETKAHGIPTVMFELPSISLANTKGIISVPQGNISLLAQKIIELINNPTTLKQLGYEARESLEEFQTTKTIDQWENIIQATINNKVSEISYHFYSSDIKNREYLMKFISEKFINQISYSLIEPHDQSLIIFAKYSKN
ncbi:Glycosyltransferase involved in cell wall bisynthesis [Brevinema andersonii]|uniref:Glycosyltransferase involved in cell wall bisynthesis n=1 Tax=Brevinema andersonii TaxID=34097 RepID=A0A1I1FBP2_BREAD|nr:glycosyltransferase [Brevinema andersonii]SFB95118.1 Glycosyltransferase involved in cell wall bisynthesis [Brevinema andersonii]